MHEEALVNHVSIITEHLLRKATNLAECALGWQGVTPTSVLLRNAIKGVACVQTSVPLRNAIKTSCLQKVVYTYVSLSFSVL